MIRSTTLALALVCAASFASAATSVDQLVKTKISGTAGKVMNIFAGKAAKEGIATRTAIDGDRRATLTGKNVEVIDLGDEMFWRYKLGRRGKVRKCEAIPFDKIREQMDALKQLPFFGNNSEVERPETSNAPESEEAPIEYEVTLNFEETGEEEVHAGLSGKVYRFEAIAHRPGMSVNEGGAILDTTFVVGPKTQAWADMQAWNKQFAELIGGITGLSSALTNMLSSSSALQEVMGELKSKESELDGTFLRVSSSLSVVSDPRAQQQREASQESRDKGGDNSVPTSLSGIGAKLGGAFLKRQKKKSDAKKAAEGSTQGPRELYTSEVRTTGLSNAADPILTLPSKCKS